MLNRDSMGYISPGSIIKQEYLGYSDTSKQTTDICVNSSNFIELCYIDNNIC